MFKSSVHGTTTGSGGTHGGSLGPASSPAFELEGEAAGSVVAPGGVGGTDGVAMPVPESLGTGTAGGGGVVVFVGVPDGESEPVVSAGVEPF